MLLGMAAVGLLKISYFVLLSSVARLHDPEKWYRIKNVVIMLLNWNVIWKFTFFLHAAGAITGAAVLFFFFSWRSQEMARDRDYAQFVRKFGGGLAIAFTFALPVYYLFYIFTTPDVAFDNGVYLLATSVSFVAMVTALLLFGVLGSDRPRYGGAVFSLLLVVFLLAGTVDLRSMSRANYEHYHALAAAAEAEKAVKEAEIESRLAQAGGAAMGEEVFNNVCTQCHRMDEKLVGPPLNEVLPKYDLEGLKAFVASPSKVNPDYPPMPNLGLTSAQINAVAAYLKGDEEGGGEGGGGTGH
jgi:cytochrome c